MAHKPHAICVPFPAQGHINPMLQVAKLLHSKGFHITFVNTEYIHNRILRSNPTSLCDFLNFRFETISNGLDPLDHEANLDVTTVCCALSNNCLAPFLNLIQKLNDGVASEVPPVTCIVSDGGMSFTIDAAQQLGIPDVLFWTSSGCGVLGYTHYPHLVEKGLAPLKDASYLTNGYLETTVDWIPGMKTIRLKDLPTFFRTTDPNDLYFNWILREVDRASRASAIIMNTYDSLEEDALNSLCKMYPHLYSIGPLHLLVDQIKNNNGIKNIFPSLWKEDEEKERELLCWLDSKNPDSVLFVNFGSTTVMTIEQLKEISWGLANSKKNFLWVLRLDHVEGEDLNEILTKEFLDDIKERGMLVSWCPSQEKILEHSSIVGFLSHMGWNSTLESLCCGIPMICLPNFSDQTTVCRYACSEWGIGIEIDKNFKREEIEKVIIELMEGEKGKEMKKKATEWKRKAQEATSYGGSSYDNLDKVLEILLGNNKMDN
ncbi:7-deoxyloganetin glucosyltransferase [Jatropha curcas]|uniref:7-deoxyloganetin glucosyltransferase n=1 Tax=Jatropha curcas TaxID=180498 RepID=UPI0005FC127C|nr:7-deoxyloganetin glucosyltransferase [Jatropha curcas]